ncbi:MAG: molybdopterin-dependent oxidoreductase [Anaerolineae bacterium]|jgi:anaerobic dimethyl sulfoxide reductase subunit A|nr:molybdopterin-dependent oxidoreductase [Anaerolineae bacterium]
MTEKDFLSKALTDTALTRRSFLKWSAALGGSAVLAGGVQSGLKTVSAAVESQAQEGKWVTAACWHNCGGQRCVVKANVVDGVVRSVKTDDTHPDTMEHPQIRACARGRSQQHQVFGVDRLKYPMKRKNWEPGGGKKELRGQDEWVRISWDEALDILASEMDRVIGKYGNEGIVEVGSSLSSVTKYYGGAVKTWGTTSWGTWYYTGPKIGLGDGLINTSHNDRLDMQKSDLIVIWAGNPAWSAQGNNMKYYLDAKKAGAKFIFIDPLYNDSAMVLADDWIPIRPATDHALALGIAHTLLVEDDPENDPLIDWDFLDRCTVGFDKEHMPDGANPKENFTDYVLGKLDGEAKTPEWASEICGVLPRKIRSLAREIAKAERVSLLSAWAPARTNNADSWPQIFMTLGAMTGNIGKSGSCTGVSCWERTADGGPFLIGAGGKACERCGPPPEIPEGTISTRVNNNELWDSVIDGKYVAGYEDVQNIDIQMIMHDGSSALNQKVGMTKGIQAHRKVEFVVSLNYVLNTNSKYSDLVLPVTTQWERAGYLKGNRDHFIWAQNIVDPLYEAKDDEWIAVELAKRLGLDPAIVTQQTPEQKVFNQLKGSYVVKSDGVTKENLLTITADDIAEMGVEGEPQEGRISIKEFRETGVYTVARKEGDKYEYIAHKAFRADPEANPLNTPSGKLEIHCQSIVDFVKNSGFNEIDPIPTYNRPIEGYEDTFADWDKKVKGDYSLQLYTIHYRRRSHSIFDNVPWLREAFPQEFLMNPLDAKARGIESGDVVQITSRHGTVIRPVHFIDRMMPGVVALGEGAWAEIDEETGIDMAGATNTLNGAIPTGQGHQGWNSCNVEVKKYTGSIDLMPDHKWAQRIPVKEM